MKSPEGSFDVGIYFAEETKRNYRPQVSFKPYEPLALKCVLNPSDIVQHGRGIEKFVCDGPMTIFFFTPDLT